jgi:putative Mg2+ transporter-C (MgtC) family protein
VSIVGLVVTEWDIVLRVLGAAAMAALVGYDRAVADKPAGVRTHLLVGAGAALFTGVTVMLAQGVESTGAQAAKIDVSRIAAGIVTGVGFLGAGAIIMRGDKVTGLTTAAGVWVVAAIGVSVGFGFWLMGLITTVLVLLTHAGAFLFDRGGPNEEGAAEPQEGAGPGQ